MAFAQCGPPDIFKPITWGLPPTGAGEVRVRVRMLSRHRASDDGQWGPALGLRQQFIDQWSSLIHAEPGTLTCTGNVTTALFSLIGALPLQRLKGQRILVAAECFPRLHFLLSGLAESQR